MKKVLLLTIVLVAIAAAGVYALLDNNDKEDVSSKASPAPSAQTDNKPAPANNNQTNDTASTDNTITYGNDGFSPGSMTVKSGSKITVANNSSKTLQFDSNPHPQHTEDPELNIGIIKAGESKTITVAQTGSHGYHNHLNADDTGVLIVE